MAAKLIASSIGKKVGMALTGLMIYGFLVGHLAGNMLLLKGDGGKGFNAYSDFLTHHPLLIPVELVLLAAFVLHIYLGINISRENRRARPQSHKKTRSMGLCGCLQKRIGHALCIRQGKTPGDLGPRDSPKGRSARRPCSRPCSGKGLAIAPTNMNAKPSAPRRSRSATLPF